MEKNLKKIYIFIFIYLGLPSGKESTCQARQAGSVQVGKIPWRKEMATHSSIHAWEIPWTAEPDRLQSMGLEKSRT